MSDRKSAVDGQIIFYGFHTGKRQGSPGVGFASFGWGLCIYKQEHVV